MQNHVFLFPGQGSQYVGMGKDLYDNFTTVRDLFAEASDTLGTNLKKLCFEGPDDILMQTENVQPAITITNISVLHVLQEHGISPAATAGHSLGEYSSLYAAGAISFVDLMRLVQARGLSMQEAAAKNPGGMIMPMGISIEKAEDICRSLPPETPVEIANINSPKQIILSGSNEALEKFSALAKTQGTKFIIPLKVSGPWHSRLMKSARERLETAIAGTTFCKPTIPLVCNAVGEYLTDEEKIKKELVVQLTSPVLWNKSMRMMIDDGHNQFIEAGPKTILKNLMRDISKDVKVDNVDNMDNLRNLLKSLKKA